MFALKVSSYKRTFGSESDIPSLRPPPFETAAVI